MGKISDEDGGWLEDEDGHGIYDLAGMNESITAAFAVSDLAGALAPVVRFKRNLTSSGQGANDV